MSLIDRGKDLAHEAHEALRNETPDEQEARLLAEQEQAAAAAAEKSPDERKQALNAGVQREVVRGWRVETPGDFQVVLLKGRRPNHILHLLLSLVTLGTWAIVWLLVALIGGEKRRVMVVDAFGNVHAGRASR